MNDIIKPTSPTSSVKNSAGIPVLKEKQSAQKNEPRVGIVVGSISDFEAAKLANAVEILKDAGVKVSFDVVSAHRSPEHLSLYAKKAKEAGVEVIIAAAGGAAHLPGMMTSFAHPIKVIGLPVHTSSDTFGGLGALFANTQMPPGASLSSVGVNASANAADEALKALAIKYPAIKDHLIEKHKKGLEEAVTKIHKALEKSGIAKYTKNNKEVEYRVKDAGVDSKIMSSDDFAEPA